MPSQEATAWRVDVQQVHRLVEPQLKKDEWNKRVLVQEFGRRPWSEWQDRLEQGVQEAAAEKIIVLARERDVRFLLRQGFVMEATVDSFWREEPVFYMSRFLTQERRESAHWVEEDRLLRRILEKERQALPMLQSPYVLRRAEEADVPQMVELYRKTFRTYPSPLCEPDYLKKSLQKDLFSVVEVDGLIVSTAAGDIDPVYHNAEMTNCATDGSYRGKRLMRHLIRHVEQGLVEMDIRNVFSIARARSYGMNAALHQEGYAYGGRLVNNCDICGGYEDMNVWGKRLSLTGKGGAQ